MKYRALMLDVDGTVVPYNYDSLPSDKLTQALKIAQNKIAVCFVTGRPLVYLKPVLKKINMHKGYAVLNNGAKVVNLASNRVLYNQPINKKDIKQICSLLEKENITFYLKQGHLDEVYEDRPYNNKLIIGTVSMIFTHEIYKSETIDKIQKLLSRIDDIVVYKTKHKNGFGINIQNVNATKLHGIQIVLKALHIDSKQTIGVGDGYNDFPLLMASGLKIAMGNAVEELKAIADFIAPSVEDDGVVTVIEKFVLNDMS